MLDALRAAETQIAEILAADDVANLAEAMQPGSPIQAIVASIEADMAADGEGN